MDKLPVPNDRVEALLYAIATGDDSDLPTPKTREEKLLLRILQKSTELCAITVDPDEVYEIDEDIPIGHILYNWDFTRSITDKVRGKAAVLYGCNQTDRGLVIDAGAENCSLGDIFGPNKVLEIKIGNCEANFDSSKHGRFIMIYAPGLNKSEGLVYRWQTQTWAFYVDGAWDASLPISDKNYFANKTIRLESDVDGYISIFADDQYIVTSGLIFDSSRTMVNIGGYADSFYDVVIESVKIKEGTHES